MKNFVGLFAMLLAAVSHAAPLDIVSVEVRLDQEQFLPNEPLLAHVRIQNSSGQTIRLGEHPGWLNFVIESIEGPYVRPIKSPDVTFAFDLESSHTATKTVDLAPCFRLTERGRYKVSATVHVPSFGNAPFISPGKAFYIGNGTKMRELVFGAPTSIIPPGEDGRPELRKYLIVQTNPGGDSRLFVRVTDANENNYRVVLVGPLVSFSKPEPQLDRWSNLHLLYQTGAKAFLYTEINPEGLVLLRERHDYTDTRPTLVSNDEGRISVKGGMRRYTNNDLPPVEPTVALAPVEEEKAPLQLSAPAPVKGGSKKKESPRPNDAKAKKK